MRIAVYTGSFNPLHKGHLAIMEKLSEDPSVGWTYLVVSPKNPLKDGISADTCRERYRAAVRAVQKYPKLKVWVDDIELGMEPPQYTVRTLDALKAREPGNDFVLTIGADNLADIRRWRDYSRILTEYGVMVYPREGFDLKAVMSDLKAENPDYRIQILDATKVNMSSTAIREALARGEDPGEWLM